MNKIRQNNLTGLFVCMRASVVMERDAGGFRDSHEVMAISPLAVGSYMHLHHSIPSDLSSGCCVD